MLQELEGYDWKEAFGEVGSENRMSPRATLGFSGSLDIFTREDVEEIRHITVGENDEEHWRIAGRLKDGRWFYVDGWCDYTGWDCQSGIAAFLADSYENLTRWGLGREERDLWDVKRWWDEKISAPSASSTAE